MRDSSQPAALQLAMGQRRRRLRRKIAEICCYGFRRFAEAGEKLESLC